MKDNIWRKAVWAFNTYRDIKKKSYPLTVLGVRLILASIVSTSAIVAVLKISFPEGFVLSGFELTANDASIYSTILGTVIVLIGIWLIIMEVKSSARHTARVLITGLPGTANSFPDNIMFRSEQTSARETVELSVPESNSGDHSVQIERYNAELCVDLFKRFILHDDCKKVYIGGLARVPFLVAYGAFLRNVSAKITYFDKFHREGSWKLLNQEDSAITFSEFQLIMQPNNAGDIGIAVAFSTEINMQQLPDDIKNNTTLLKPNAEIARNLIQNQENLHQISESIRDLIEKLSHISECKRIHLFLSVQSTLAIELGRRYQEGTQCNWVIHNFNFPKGEYDWAIELSKDGIKSFG